MAIVATLYLNDDKGIIHIKEDVEISAGIEEDLEDEIGEFELDSFDCDDVNADIESMINDLDDLIVFSDWQEQHYGDNTKELLLDCFIDHVGSHYYDSIEECLQKFDECLMGEFETCFDMLWIFNDSLYDFLSENDVLDYFDEEGYIDNECIPDSEMEYFYFDNKYYVFDFSLI
jgi:hypothetical protein